MRAIFVFTVVIIALALGAVVGASESRLLTRTLVVGFIPVMWALSYAIERVSGRDMWHFSAPSVSVDERSTRHGDASAE
jgi:hypothetical protein